MMYVAELYRTVWKGSPAQWAYLVLLLAALVGMVVMLATALHTSRLERQLLRAVLAMARVPDDAGRQGRRDGRHRAPPTETAAVLPAEAAPPPRRMASTGTTAAPEHPRGPATVGERAAAGKPYATGRR